MSRSQRVRDNWAMIYAQEQAVTLKVPLHVVFCLVPRFLDAAWRQYEFMIRGLELVASGLEKLSIPFHLVTGEPVEIIPETVRRLKASLLVTDFDPLRVKRSWVSGVAAEIAIPFYEADNRNIIPCWLASPKQEYAAYTFRPKVTKQLPAFLVEPPPLIRHPFPPTGASRAPVWDSALKGLAVDRTVETVPNTTAGEEAAAEKLHIFCNEGLPRYPEDRNDPNAGSQSGMSLYLHFGQISSLRVAIEVLRSGVLEEAKENFLEELITRRELADNYCYYCEAYDSWDGFPEWAKRTLDEHRWDKREFLYSPEELENGKTHDDLWNAAQHQMMREGTMPGFLRMYWAKKILEWTPSPEEALATAIYINDRYQLDGRDPNGYAGVAWSIGGVHDRAWPARPIFGKIRFMSYRGCRSKFDVDRYISSSA